MQKILRNTVLRPIIDSNGLGSLYRPVWGLMTDLPSESCPLRSMAFEPVEDAGTAQKKHRAEEIVAKLRQVDVVVLQGPSVTGAVRLIGGEA